MGERLVRGQATRLSPLHRSVANNMACVTIATVVHRRRVKAVQPEPHVVAGPALALRWHLFADDRAEHASRAAVCPAADAASAILLRAIVHVLDAIGGRAVAAAAALARPSSGSFAAVLQARRQRARVPIPEQPRDA